MIYFTSDLHLDHENILTLATRPFESIEDMNAHLIEEINRVVGRRDTLVLAGDIGWKSWSKYRPRLKVKTIHYVQGNHDKKSYDQYFTSAGLGRMVKIGTAKHQCWVSHYPHIFWPASHHGSFHVYGHCHAQRESYLDAFWPERRSMDIGVDSAFLRFGEHRPFSEDDVLAVLGDRPGHHNTAYEKQFQKELYDALDKPRDSMAAS